jgi:putative hydrolase of the HAD superfamily
MPAPPDARRTDARPVVTGPTDAPKEAGPTDAGAPVTSRLRAVLWDFGGVVTTGPWEAFNAYERRQGLPEGFLRRLNATNPDANAWALLERSEIDVPAFVDRFQAEARAAGGTVDALEVLAALRGEVRPAMAEAVRRCHEHLRTGLLTNNFAASGWRERAGEVVDHFDLILESASAGVRKPDPRFYLRACEELGVEPGEAVFLDDLGVNLKPARELGMITIKVVDPDVALAELEAVVGFALRSR